MKKVMLFVAALMTFIACSQSPEDKANALIKESMKKTLYRAETYDPVETVVDSAFTPFDDPAFYEKTVMLCNLSMDVDKYERMAKSEKREIALYQDMLRIMYSNSDKESLNQAQENYKDYLAKKSEAEESCKKLAEQLMAELQKEPRFIGFKAIHRYRAQNNGGQTVFGETKFLFDKDMSQIVYGWDIDEDEYKAVQALFGQMRGEDN
ncbi:MAG: hypothetical protein IJ764_05115 [Bacteroidales bacterium]|nr:hypothetical protein [Bacteroidales bacterium]